MGYRKKGLALLVIVALAVIGMIGAYLFVTNHQKSSLLHKGPSIGVVRMDEVIRLNPSYEEYQKAQRELEDLQAQYQGEQASLNAKVTMREEALKSLSLDQGLTDSYNTELKAKLKAREDQMNADLDRKRHELMAKYVAEQKLSPRDTDLAIVNLQLALMTYDRPLPYDPDQRQAFLSKKADLQAQLQELLAKRKPNISGNIADIRARVEAELKPIMEEGQKDLDAYAQSVHKDLSAKRDSDLQAKAKGIMDESNLPNAAQWNQTWQERLDDKQAQVDAIYQSMEEDVRMRVAVIAESQHLDLVLALDREEANVSGLDITDAIVTSYGVEQEDIMKRTKSLVIGAVMVGAMSLLAGCGSDKVGYVDTNKIVQQSQKMADVNKDVAAKKAELEAKMNAVDQSNATAVQKAQQDAQAEFEAYTNSKDKEIQDYFEDEVGKVAKQEGITVVLAHRAVAAGGVDLTDKVLDAVGRADTSSQEANQQAAGQATNQGATQGQGAQ